MASDGLTNKAKRGTCRICQRSRSTKNQVKAVGEVHHGYATGHIWECIDTAECDKVATEKINSNINGAIAAKIEKALTVGRYIDYKVFY